MAPRTRRPRLAAPGPAEAEPLLTDTQRRWTAVLLAGGLGFGLLPSLLAPADPLKYWLAFALLPLLVMGLAGWLAGRRSGRRFDAWLLLGGRRDRVVAQPVASLPAATRAALEEAALPAMLGALSRVAAGRKAAQAAPARRLLALGRERLADPDARSLLADHLPLAVTLLAAGRDEAIGLAEAMIAALEQPGPASAAALAASAAKLARHPLAQYAAAPGDAA